MSSIPLKHPTNMSSIPLKHPTNMSSIPLKHTTNMSSIPLKHPTNMSSIPLKHLSYPTRYVPLVHLSVKRPFDIYFICNPIYFFRNNKYS